MGKRLVRVFWVTLLTVNAVPVVVASWLFLASVYVGQQPLGFPASSGTEEGWSDHAENVLRLEVIVPADSNFTYRLRPQSVSVGMESCPVRLVVRREEPSLFTVRASSRSRR